MIGVVQVGRSGWARALAVMLAGVGTLHFLVPSQFDALIPRNVKMAVDWSDRSPAEQAIAYGRLPLQIPLVL